MKLRFLVCSTAATVDQATKNVSITSILEQLTSPVFPAAIPMTLVAMLERKVDEPEEVLLQIEFRIDGQDPPILAGPANLSFQGQLNTRLLASISPLVIPRPGQLTAELRSRNKLFGSWAITVLQAASETFFGTSPSPPKMIAKKGGTAKKAKKGKARRR
jgi:hypothetical protein